MTDQIMKVSLRKLKECNLMLSLEWQLPVTEHLRISSTANYFLNLWNSRVGLGKMCFFKNTYQNTYLTLFLKPIIYTILTCCKMIQHFRVELMFSSTPFCPSTTLEWNKLNRRIQQFSTMLLFRNTSLKIGWPTPKPLYNIHDPKV